MKRWAKSGLWGATARPSAAADPVPDADRHAGEYQLLYKYLRDRFANRIVLTFAEIEDLLGFALPDSARTESAWWAGTDQIAHRSAQADAWIRANRTATVNLSARIVVFERDAGC